MSFKNVKAEDLLLVATEDLSLEVMPGATKAQILAAIAENGVTWEEAVELSPTIESINRAMNASKVVTTESLKTPVVVPTPAAPVEDNQEIVVVETPLEPAKVLIRMERANPTFHIRGYKFSHEHPYVLVREDDAVFLTTSEDGFYYATPLEAQEYYG